MKRVFATAAPLFAIVAVFISACAPGPSTTPGQPAGGEQGAQRSSEPKVLTVAIVSELEAWNTDLIRASRSGGITLLHHIAHNKLVVETGAFAWVPQLAVEQLSIEKGTWQVNPDKTMVTTWRIHPNVRWHDGAPFTSDDLMFTFNVMKDPEIPNPVTAPLRVMQSATAPDPYTFVINWSAPYVDADQAPWLTIMPRHLMEDAYKNDKAGFLSHPWITTDFVGLGPYRLSKWERGSHMEFTRFDQYFRGRPPLDTVIMRFIPDETVQVAAMLAGSLDAIPASGSGTDVALEVQRRWEGTGNRVGGNLSGRFYDVEPQHRTEVARPLNGLADVTVRRAFYQAIDRDQLVDALSQGLGPPADSWFFPGHELRPQIESAIPRFPYDVTAAARQLGEAGWTRGADRILVHSQTGSPFDVQIATQREDAKAASIVANAWRAIGARVEEFPITADRLDDLEALSKSPGARMGSQTFFNMYTNRFHSAGIAAPGNRWTGRNRSGYNNPRMDALLDQLVATIAPAERLPLHRELLQEQMGDLVVMPLYWGYDSYFVAKGVKGGSGDGWNFFEWDKE
ncbi:MAG: hypothetical protein HW416_3328 [Chloroflexi bacterium]|nr:hypothetical protein [Chloroflexota bacterium]